MPSCLERLSQNYDSANVFRKTTKLRYVEFPTDCELNFIGVYKNGTAAYFYLQEGVPYKDTAIALHHTMQIYKQLIKKPQFLWLFCLEKANICVL